MPEQNETGAVCWRRDADGFSFPHGLTEGQFVSWRFGALNAWRAIDRRGVMGQGITLTLRGARRRGRRWADRGTDA